MDRSLSRLYRSGEIGPVLKRWFEPRRAGEMLKAVFLLNGLPGVGLPSGLSSALKKAAS